jgi:hypothetical protein
MGGSGTVARWGRVSPRTSPEQIAGRMELEGSEHAISTESIYRHVYSPAGRRAGLPRLLAQRKPKRGRRRRNGRREPAIPNRTPIQQRPTKAHLRSQFEHWEGDLMHFRRQRDILLTLQAEEDRKSIQWIDFPTKALPADAGPAPSAGGPARGRTVRTGPAPSGRAAPRPVRPKEWVQAASGSSSAGRSSRRRTRPRSARGQVRCASADAPSPAPLDGALDGQHDGAIRHERVDEKPEQDPRPRSRGSRSAAEHAMKFTKPRSRLRPMMRNRLVTVRRPGVRMVPISRI